MIDFVTPLAGLQHATDALNQSAKRIQSVGLTPQGDAVDLSAEMLALILARNNFAANTKVIQAADEVTQSAINLLG
jgi:flagellar hook protein FlgE